MGRFIIDTIHFGYHLYTTIPTFKEECEDPVPSSQLFLFQQRRKGTKKKKNSLACHGLT